MKHTCKHNARGMAMVVTVAFLAVAILILGALTVRIVTQSNQVTQYTNYRDCFYGLDGAVALSKTSLESGGTGFVGFTGAVQGYTFANLPDFGDPGVAPIAMDTMPRVQYFAVASNWMTDGIDNNGDGTVDGVDENFTATIYGLATCGGVVRRVEEVVKGFDVNVWRNAIFGGTGATGGLINGNVSIHGSVHLLGNALPNTTLAVSAIDLSGTSLIHNNYTGIPVELSSRVPALPTTIFNGETIGTLNAKLRVKNGLVGMSGNSEIGEPNIAGNTIKETMDGTYTTDGWTGNSVTPDGGRGIPKNVYSDNGWDSGYDLGDKIPFPTLNDAYRDPLTGATVLNPATGANYTHSEYFATLCGTPYAGNMLIKCNTNFYYNATRPTQTDPTLKLPTDDYIYFNATTNRMEINGQVKINGDLTFTRGSGNDDTINYTGRGALLVTGNAVIDTNLLSVNANGTLANSYPQANCFGIMAMQNLTVGSNAQLMLMGAFYAQGIIKSSKQTITAGTFVSNYFDMGTNVPEIFQVPALADNLPTGMIGAYPILVFSRVSWREFGV